MDDDDVDRCSHHHQDSIHPFHFHGKFASRFKKKSDDDGDGTVFKVLQRMELKKVFKIRKKNSLITIIIIHSGFRDSTTFFKKRKTEDFE